MLLCIAFYVARPLLVEIRRIKVLGNAYLSLYFHCQFICLSEINDDDDDGGIRYFFQPWKMTENSVVRSPFHDP